MKRNPKNSVEQERIRIIKVEAYNSIKKYNQENQQKTEIFKVWLFQCQICKPITNLIT